MVPASYKTIRSGCGCWESHPKARYPKATPQKQQQGHQQEVVAVAAGVGV
jgi:hypothetical protein